MDNQLTVRQQELAILSSEQGIDTLLQPLVREIHLFDSFIAGTAFCKNAEALASLRTGDKLKLLREEKKFDKNAVAIYKGEERIGYVPEKDEVVFARLMDAGKLLTAAVKDVQKTGSAYQIAIGIYLTDI